MRRALLASSLSLLLIGLSFGSPYAGEPSGRSGAVINIVYRGNAQRLGAIRTDDDVTPEGVTVVCGQASQGISSCSFPPGEACCSFELLNIEAGASVRFTANAGRGQVDFGGWGGDCAQTARRCPFAKAVTDPSFRRRVCPGGVDSRGVLVSSPTGSRAHPNAVFGCDITLPQGQGASSTIEATWSQFDPDNLPDVCGLQLTELPCGSPAPTSSTTTTTLLDPPPDPPACGDPDGSGDTSATDALRALQAAVGGVACLECVCDVTGDALLTATDALRILTDAVGLGSGFLEDCPPCAGGG